jgi:hypothetical protein
MRVKARKALNTTAKEKSVNASGLTTNTKCNT